MSLTFHRHLYRWYEIHGRKSLPWRNTKDAYAILVSETMLQQTQVKTVLERYYVPFLESLPTIEALAAAPIEKVLKLWQGMGYYRRAVNLHNAAKLAVSGLPHSVEELLALPGIGQNTAHAVAAFAYRQPVAVMEANVKRILYRVFALEQAKDKELWQYAGELLDKDDPFTYNQAMMDIGAMVCTKTQPKCQECPLHTICKGKENPLLYPAAKAKKTTPIRKKNIIVFSYREAGENYFYVAPRETRFLSGLFGFQEYAKGKPVVFYNMQYELTGYLGSIEQTYSHFKLEADVYHIGVGSGLGIASDYWKCLDAVHALPLSKADEKIMVLLDKHLNKKAA